MKRILFFGLILISIHSFGQPGRKPGFVEYQTKNQVTGTWNNKFGNIPLGDTVSTTVLGLGQIVRDTLQNKNYQVTSLTDKRWTEIAGSGGGVDDVPVNNPIQYYGKDGSGNKGFQEAGRVQTYDNVSSMLSSFASTKGFTRCITRGFYSIGDKGDAEYNWVSSSHATVDNILVFVPTGYDTTNAGRLIYTPRNGVYNIRQLGAKADGATSIRTILQSVIDGVSIGNIRRVQIPIGDYYCDSTITIVDRAIDLYGESGAANGLGSIINFPSARTGIKITRTSGYQYGRVHDLVILATGHVSDPSEQYNGLDVSAITRIERLTIGGFSGNGLVLHGNVGLGTDVSLSLVSSVTCSSNEASGFKMYYGDGNQITFLNCDARDNGKYGFNDSSFLGNQFYGCHGNNNPLGHYRVWDINARSSLFGCYGEAGSSPSIINGSSMVMGGIHANGISTATYAEGSTVYNAGFNFVKPGTTGQNIGVWIHEGQMEFYGENGGTLFFRNNSQLNHTHYSWDFGNGNYSKKAFQYLDGGSHLTANYTSIGEAPEYTRDMQTFGVAARNFYTDGRKIGAFYYSYPSTYLSSQFFDGEIFRTGDILHNANYNGHNVEAVRCIVSGTYGTYSEGRTATGTGTTVKLNAATTVLKLGDYVTINGTKTQIININSGKDTLTLESGVTASASAITYAQPTFSAVGRMWGTAAQMPTLTTSDKGVLYFNTDDSTVNVWSGYQWLGMSGGGGGGSYTADESTLHLTGSQFSVKTSYDATLAKLAGNQSFTGNNTFDNAIVAPELQWDANTRIYKTTTAGYPAWRIIGSGSGAILQLQNLNGSGYTGTEYLKDDGSLGTFAGLRISTGEFRFNNVASGGTIAFKIASDDALVINNDKSITYPYGSGTGNRFAYLDASGVLKRSSIDPSNVVQTSGGGTITGTPTGSKFLRDDFTWQDVSGGGGTGVIVNLDTTPYDSLAVAVATDTLGIKRIRVRSSDASATVTKTATSTHVDYDISIPITNGTYQPTVSNTSNVTSSTTYNNVGYSKNGNQVYVNGKITVQPTATGTVSFQITLPVTTATFSSDGMAAGGLYADNSDNANTGRIYATTSASTVTIKYKALTTSSTDFSFSFAYTIQPL